MGDFYYTRKISARAQLQEEAADAAKGMSQLLREQREEEAAEGAPKSVDIVAPTDKPDPRAQWDEKRGQWMVWSVEDGDWAPYRA